MLKNVRLWLRKWVNQDSMNLEHFVGQCIRDMISSGVTIEITRRKNMSTYSHSYFTESNGVVPNFRINYFKNDFDFYIPTFLHEYCHFLQWKNKSTYFIQGIKSTEKYYKWLNGEHEQVDIEDLRNIQRMELDCDRRAIKSIKKYNLDIDLQQYILESNSYIISHNYVHEKRKYFSSFPYAKDCIKCLVPNKHLKMTQLGMSIPEHRKLFLEYAK